MSSHPYLRRARRSHALTLRSPFGERGERIPLCRDAVPTLPIPSLVNVPACQLASHLLRVSAASSIQSSIQPSTQPSIQSSFGCIPCQLANWPTDQLVQITLCRDAVPTLPRGGDEVERCFAEIILPSLCYELIIRGELPALESRIRQCHRGEPDDKSGSPLLLS